MTFVFYVLLWTFIGSCLSNFLWIGQDLFQRLKEDKGKYDSDYYARIYTRGLMLGLLLGPFCVIFNIKQAKDFTKKLKEIENE